MIFEKFKKRKGETAGRKVFSRWSLLGFGWRHDVIARDYMERWTISTPFGAVRLHKIMRSDDRVALHDHPMDFVSVIIAGGYKEHRYAAEPRWYFPGDINVKRAEDLHALELLEEGEPTWTLVFARPFRRDWGFMTDDEGWVSAGEYDAWKERRFKRQVVKREQSGPEAKSPRYVEDFGDEELRRVAERNCTCDALSVSLQQCGCVCDACAARREVGRRRVAVKGVNA